jgi:type VI secretion system protein VasJ
MLGRLRRRPWRWAAFGKHPVAADFLRIGPEDPVLSAFGQWVAAGFPGRERCAEQYSWRFFAPGASGELVCGLLTGSGDRVGRPFPFAVLGTGPYKGWEKSWTLLPLALEEVWRRLEYFPGRAFRTVPDLKADMAELRMPAPRWDRWREESASLPAGPPPEPRQAENGMAIYDLCPGSPEERLACLMAATASAARSAGKPPAAVFAGGGSKTRLAVLFRPLRKSDFSRLCAPDFPH